MGFFDLFKSKPTQASVAGTAKRPDYAAQHRAGDLAAQVRGRHYVDWVPLLDEMRAEGRDDEALDLLLACIAGAERHAQVVGREPAPGYTERAAIIFRRRGSFADEIAVIERWEAACPPERRGPGKTQDKLVERKRKALELLNK